MHFALLASAFLPIVQDVAPAAVEGLPIVLPESAAARAFSGVGPETEPAEIPGVELFASPAPWQERATWDAWAQALRAECDATSPDPARRALLCRLARNQGRDADAWAHFATLTASPEHAAAALPFLFPGVPGNTKILAGGLPAPLPSGVLLSPALPPVPTGRGPLAFREVKYAGLRIGDSVCDLLVNVESTGVQLDLLHISGGPATVRVLLPEPEGFEIRVEYVDWMRADVRHGVHLIELIPGGEKRTVYGRVLQRSPERPTATPATIPAQLGLAGLWLNVGEGALGGTAVESAAAVLRDLLEIDVYVGDTQPGDKGLPPTVVRIPTDAAGQARTLRYLTGQAEAFLFGRR